MGKLNINSLTGVVFCYATGLFLNKSGKNSSGNYYSDNLDG
jgi:hypothetical protein